MDAALLLAGAVFAAALIPAWLALHLGTRWFARREQRVARTAASDLERMFIFIDANRVMVAHLAALLALPLLAWCITASPALVAGAVGAAVAAPRVVLRRLAARRQRQFEAQLPDALMMIVGALRAGASLPMALDSLASEARPPVSQEFALLLRELRLGTDFAVALRNLEARVPLDDLALVTAGMALAREVGANLAETLEAIAATLRAKLRMEGKIRSLTAQGKMQGIVMSGLPVFLIVVLQVMEPEAMAPLFEAWYGWCTLGLIALAIAAGYHFIGRITRIDV
jgi:tight adherence protein B